MGYLYLVRHGQASLGAPDYDQLSPLGVQQSQRLGAYFADNGIRFEAVLTGTLRRHVQTYAGICTGGGIQMDALQWPGLNEFDGAAVIRAIHPEPLPRPSHADPAAYRQHFRLLRDGLTQWMNGVVSPQGMASYDDFRHGVVSALDHIRQQYSGNVLVVSSGGPIATAVGHILGTTPETTIELNLRLRNTAVTECVFSAKRHTLQTFNGLPHLAGADYAGWVTAA